MANGRFVPMEKYSKVAVAGDVTANYVEFTLPTGFVGAGAIPSVMSSAGVVNSTGLTVTFPVGKVRVAVTALALSSVVSVIVFE